MENYVRWEIRCKGSFSFQQTQLWGVTQAWEAKLNKENESKLQHIEMKNLKAVMEWEFP